MKTAPVNKPEEPAWLSIADMVRRMVKPVFWMFCQPEIWSVIYVIFFKGSRLRVRFEKFSSPALRYYIASLLVIPFLPLDSEVSDLLGGLSLLIFFSYITWKEVVPQYGGRNLLVFSIFLIFGLVGIGNISQSAWDFVVDWIFGYYWRVMCFDFSISTYVCHSFFSCLTLFGIGFILETTKGNDVSSSLVTLSPVIFLFSIRRFDESLNRSYRRQTNNVIRRSKKSFINRKFSLHFISMVGYLFGELMFTIVKSTYHESDFENEVSFPFSCNVLYRSFFILCFLLFYSYKLGIIEELVGFSLPEEEREEIPEFHVRFISFFKYLWIRLWYGELDSTKEEVEQQQEEEEEEEGENDSSDSSYYSEEEEEEGEEEDSDDSHHMKKKRKRKKKKKKKRFRTCGNCRKKSDGKKKWMKCARCKIVFYCSLDCQRDHWMIHKEICNEIEMLRKENDELKTRYQMLLVESVKKGKIF